MRRRWELKLLRADPNEFPAHGGSLPVDPLVVAAGVYKTGVLECPESLAQGIEVCHERVVSSRITVKGALDLLVL